METWRYASDMEAMVGFKMPSDGFGDPIDPVTSDGGPSSYYDFHPDWVTFNDFMEHKAKTQWQGYALHLKDIGKAICRFGVKAGTTDAYDARKIIYSGLRLMGMIAGKDAMRAELLKLLDDPQFK